MKAATQRKLRLYHSWLGMFFAPLVIFFALSGTLQSLGYQDPDGSYRPSPSMTLIANVHKHGVARTSESKKNSSPDPGVAPASSPSAKSVKPFSLLSALLGIFLAVATILGISIGVANRRGRGTAVALLVAGIAVPLFLLMM